MDQMTKKCSAKPSVRLEISTKQKTNNVSTYLFGYLTLIF